MDPQKSIMHWLQRSIRRTSPALKIALLAMILLGTLALVALGIGIHQIREETRSMQQQAAILEEENADLSENLAGLDTVQIVIKLARQLLGLERPDAIIIDPAQPTQTQ